MIPALVWPWRRPRLGLAFSERCIVFVREEAPARPTSVSLPPGLLTPSPVTTNIQGVAEVGRLASALMEAQEGPTDVDVAIVLPDMSVVTRVFPSGGKLRRRELQEQLRAGLPFPASEARTDFWRGARGASLGAAVRRVVVRQYEQVVDALGRRPGWIDAASLAGIPLWARASSSNEGLAARIDLYVSYYSLAVFVRGELVDLRFKLRPPDDVEGVAREVTRLPGIYGEPLGSLALSGSRASDCAQALEGELGREKVTVSEMSEERLLARAAAALLARRR